MIHELKILKEHYENVVSGKKGFELRRNDRNYKVGDYLALNEIDPDTGNYTRRSSLVKVTCIIDHNDLSEALKENYVVLGISLCWVGDDYIEPKCDPLLSKRILTGCERPIKSFGIQPKKEATDNA